MISYRKLATFLVRLIATGFFAWGLFGFSIVLFVAVFTLFSSFALQALIVPAGGLLAGFILWNLSGLAGDLIAKDLDEEKPAQTSDSKRNIPVA
ncbi:MAG TPA: hypothetical protein VKC60_05895 [Opitutaceae bacterium]|nr:hypothetical protein [Opitutaceae bacterium]